MAKSSYPDRLSILLTLGDPRPEGAVVEEDVDVGDAEADDAEHEHEHGEACGCGSGGGYWGSPETWGDYGAMGITKEDEPYLVAMATDKQLLSDDSDGPAGFAPIHAWRALGRMGSEAAIKSLADILDYLIKLDHDWGLEELPHVFAAIGPASIGELRRVIPDQRRDMYARAAAANALQYLGLAHPSCRGEVVRVLAGQLGLARFNDPDFNAFVVGNLIELRAVEAEGEIRKAYEGGHVEETVCGTLEDVMKELHEPARRR